MCKLTSSCLKDRVGQMYFRNPVAQGDGHLENWNLDRLQITLFLCDVTPTCCSQLQRWGQTSDSCHRLCSPPAPPSTPIPHPPAPPSALRENQKFYEDLSLRTWFWGKVKHSIMLNKKKIVLALWKSNINQVEPSHFKSISVTSSENDYCLIYV